MMLFRSLSCVLSVFMIAFCGSFATCQDLRYVDMRSDGASIPLLQTNALPMSGFPATLCMALSKEHSVLRTVDVDGKIWQWELHPPPKPVLVGETEGEPACAAISKDGRLLAIADLEGNVSLTDLDRKEVKFSDSSHGARIVALRFSDDGNWLASVASDGQVRGWSVASADIVFKFRVDASDLQCIAFSPDAQTIAIASFSNEVTLFGFGPDGRLVRDRVLSVAGSKITAIAFTPTGSQLVIAAADGTASVRDLTDSTELIELIELDSHPFAIWSLSFDPSGKRMVAGSWDGTTRIWATKGWRLIQKLKSHQESISSTLLDDLGMVSAGLDGRLMFWPVQPPSVRPTGMITGSTEPVWVTTYSDDGSRFFVGGRGQRYQIWDTNTNAPLATIKGHPTTRCATFSPDGKLVATGGDDHEIWISSSEDGKLIRKFVSNHRSISALIFVDEGKTLISGCDKGILRFWETSTGKQLSTLRKHKQQLYCAAASPDRKWLVTGGGHWAKGDPGELIVWNLKSRSFHKSLSGHKLTVWSIVFAKDGSYFAASDSAGEVKIWDTETLKEIRSLQHDTWLRPLAMSPDGRTLAVGVGDGSVRLWDTETWQQKASYTGHESFTFWLEYSPGGKTLASSSNDGTIRFWDAK